MDRLLDTPDEIRFLAPLIIREIIYRLLRGEQGARLSHLLVSEGDTRRISRAVEQLRENLDQPLKIENMARDLGMSVSGFHFHFKSVTAMSPVQFQKQIRLQAVSSPVCHGDVWDPLDGVIQTRLLLGTEIRRGEYLLKPSICAPAGRLLREHQLVVNIRLFNVLYRRIRRRNDCVSGACDARMGGLDILHVMKQRNVRFEQAYHPTVKSSKVLSQAVRI